MAEWKLFQFDSPRPDHSGMERPELEQLAAGHISRMLSKYGTVNTLPDFDTHPRTPWKVLELGELTLADESGLYIGQCPQDTRGVITDCGVYSVELLRHDGRLITGLAVYDPAQYQHTPGIVDFDEALPSLEVLTETVDALAVVHFDLESDEENIPRRRLLDPTTFPRVNTGPGRHAYCLDH